MKKILTLLLIACAITTVHAQSREETRRVILGDRNSVGNYPAYSPDHAYGDRRAEIDRVMREYDARIRSVWNDPYLHHGQKKRAVRDLERERQIRVDEINRRYTDWERNKRRDWHDGRY